MKLDPETIKIISQTAILEYKKAEKIEKKRVKDARLHNIKLLLKNYNRLSQFVENVCEDDEEDVTIEELMKSDNVIESIKESTARTKMMFDYVAKTLDNFKVVTSNEEKKLLYTVIQMRFIKKCTIDEICDETNSSKRTVYRMIDEACDVLAVLMFGVDGINFKE